MYRLPNVARVIILTRLKRAGHLARFEEGRGILKILTDKITETSGRPVVEIRP